MLVPIFEIFSFSSKYFQLISNQRSLIGLVNGQLTWYCTRSKKLFHTNGQLLSQKWMHSALSVRDYDKRLRRKKNITKGRGIHLKNKYGGARGEYDDIQKDTIHFLVEFHLSGRFSCAINEWNIKHLTYLPYNYYLAISRTGGDTRKYESHRSLSLLNPSSSSHRK